MSSELRAGILALPAARADASSVPAPDAGATSSSVGVCLSGGGSRALTCAMGQLRALRLLGKLDQVFAISSVSGGTWAHSLFTYLPAAISDDEFLGPPVLDPGELTHRTACPGHAATAEPGPGAGPAGRAARPGRHPQHQGQVRLPQLRPVARPGRRAGAGALWPVAGRCRRLRSPLRHLDRGVPACAGGILARNPGLSRQTLQVLPNAWFGVAGRQPVEVLWVYNDFVRDWWSQLALDVRLALDTEGQGAFPRYPTFTQLELSPTLVNALAHLSCWNLASDSARGNPQGQTNAQVVNGMFA